MQTLAFIKCFANLNWLILSAAFTAVLGAEPLSFNPIKLVFLIGWVYLCLYIVQRAQSSSLVPKRFRAIVSVALLFWGPLLLFVLLIVNAVQEATESRRGMLEIVKEQLRNLTGNIRFSGFVKPEDDSKIKLLDSSGNEREDIYGLGKNRRDNPVVKLTEQIITNALEEQASDILIDPKDDSVYTIRYRVDGILKVAYHVNANVCKSVIISIKALSDMDIAERRRPQDGSFTAKMGDVSAAFRVASAGVRSGEKLSIRVLNQDASRFMLSSIGLSQKQQTIIENIIAKPAGMILMCGPTGSGKTTTLYAMLNEIDLYTRNVITIEDPIEYVLPNASQIEINPKAEITFAKSLRSVLRQDPDVICVGEIRDEETASIALRASQTGHLVLATMHCNTNASALVRLLDLDVTPILMSSGLDIVISQRLLRRLCDNCKKPAQLTQSQIENFRSKEVNYRNIFQATGCRQCAKTGYRGRIAIFDILILTDKLKTSIANKSLLITQMREDDDKKSQSKLRKQGLKKVVTGITSLEELKRVVG